MAYIFRPAKADDVNAVFSLFARRVRWMDEKGIRQWNVTGYLSVYPKSYYQEQQSCGTLYVLVGKAVAGAAVLLEQDERWLDKADSAALYIHHLVTDPAVGGIGKVLLAEVEKIADMRKKQYVRLDCSADNQFLNRYYASMGYGFAGRCQDGPYIGNRLEKQL